MAKRVRDLARAVPRRRSAAKRRNRVLIPLAEGRNLGFKADKLHALERSDYLDLSTKLDRSPPSS